MREYEWNIDKALTKGLSPEPIPVNAEFLYKCLGFRCGRGRIEPHIPLTNPIPNTIDMFYNWPFPQFITGEKYNIMVVRETVTNQWDSVYLVSADHNTVTHLFDVDVLTFGLGTLMEVADFGEYIFMTNGVVTVIWDVALGAWLAVPASVIIPMMRTVCNFKGQAVGGGISSAWYDCDETFYAWSEIGYMNFTLSETNEPGYRRCPYGGAVQHTRRLGDLVVGYSSKGITMLFPVGEPATTFGFKEVCDIGIINQGAMNGNLARHIFVGEDYIVREVTKEGVKELGYQYYIKQLAGEAIIISFDPAKSDFYIGNSTKTFLLSSNGMTEVLQHPSAVWRSNNQSYMLPDTVDSDLPTITSEPIDMGYAGQKTISSIETDASVVDSPMAGADCTFDNRTWTLATYKPVNNQGVSALTVSGNAFRISMTFAELYETSRISYIKTRFKMTDLRGMRGVYAPPTSFRGQGA